MPVEVPVEPGLVDHSKDQFWLFHIIHGHIEGEHVHGEDIVLNHDVNKRRSEFSHWGVSKSDHSVELRVEDLALLNNSYSCSIHHNLFVSFTDANCVVGEVAAETAWAKLDLLLVGSWTKGCRLFRGKVVVFTFGHSDGVLIRKDPSIGWTSIVHYSDHLGWITYVDGAYIIVVVIVSEVNDTFFVSLSIYNCSCLGMLVRLVLGSQISCRWFDPGKFHSVRISNCEFSFFDLLGLVWL